MRCFYLILIAFMIFPYKSQAEQARGGANAVICFKSLSSALTIRKMGGVIPNKFLNDIKSVELLDVYQAQLESGFERQKSPLVQPRPNENAIEFADRIIQRISHAAPPLAAIFNFSKKEFAKNITYEVDGLIKVDDTFHKSLTGENDKCVLSTVAVQTSLNQLSKLQIDPRLFDRMDTLNQAATFLHEFALRELRSIDTSYEYVKGTWRLKQSVTSSVRELLKIILQRDMNVKTLIETAEAMGFLDVNDNGLGKTYLSAYPYVVVRNIMLKMMRASSNYAESVWIRHKSEYVSSFKFDSDFQSAQEHLEHAQKYLLWCKERKCFEDEVEKYKQLSSALKPFVDKIESEFRGDSTIAINKAFITSRDLILKMPGVSITQKEAIELLFKDKILPDMESLVLRFRKTGVSIKLREMENDFEPRDLREDIWKPLMYVGPSFSSYFEKLKKTQVGKIAFSNDYVISM